VPYQFATQRQDFSDFASGRVFHGLPGYPAFPIRLASEIFEWCIHHRRAVGLSGRCIVYDPCCGAAYLLSTLAHLHREHIAGLIASDIDETALGLARRNLSLLTIDGLEARIREIEAMLKAYGKESHRAALNSAKALRGKLANAPGDKSIEQHLFQADATDPTVLRDALLNWQIDIVITDVPYGAHSVWRTNNRVTQVPLDHVQNLLESLLTVLRPTSLVAIASDKHQRPNHARYRRLKHYHIGKRQVSILQPLF